MVDTLGLDPDRRQSYRDRARAAGLPAVLVIVDTPGPTLPRTGTPSATAPYRPTFSPLSSARSGRCPAQAEAEGWDRVVVLTEHAQPADPAPAVDFLDRC